MLPLKIQALFVLYLWANQRFVECRNVIPSELRLVRRTVVGYSAINDSRIPFYLTHTANNLSHSCRLRPLRLDADRWHIVDGVDLLLVLTIKRARCVAPSLNTFVYPFQYGCYAHLVGVRH